MNFDAKGFSIFIFVIFEKEEEDTRHVCTNKKIWIRDRMESKIHGTRKYSNSHPKQIEIKFFQTSVDGAAVARLKLSFLNSTFVENPTEKNDKKYFLGKTKMINWMSKTIPKPLQLTVTRMCKKK